MKWNWIIRIVGWLLCTLFLYSGLIKLFSLEEFMAQFERSVVTRTIGFNLGFLVPAVELLVAAMVVIPAVRPAGFLLAALLMMVFTAYLVYVRVYDPQPGCSCGGILERMSFRQHLVFNLLVVGWSLVAWMKARKMTAVAMTDPPMRGQGVTLLLCALFLSGCEESERVGTAMPDFVLQTANHQLVRPADLRGGGNTIVVYYSTECPRCQALITQLDQHANRFSHTTLVYMTAATLQEMDSFAKRIKLTGAGNVYNGIDSGHTFLKYNSIEQVPGVYVYDKNRKLIAEYSGVENYEELLQYN